MKSPSKIFCDLCLKECTGYEPFDIYEYPFLGKLDLHRSCRDSLIKKFRSILGFPDV